QNRSIVEIKARRIQFLNKREKFSENNNGHSNDNSEDDSVDFTEDSFDKFLSNEESDLLK
ncbi:MAG: single-stranded DNA-binding protein, partial [Ignavibacteriaceae bacterium]